MNFVEAVSSGFRNYVNFSGRAIRSEYWYWTLFATVVVDVLGVIDQLLYPGARMGAFSIVDMIISLALVLPGIAVSVRRLQRYRPYRLVGLARADSDRRLSTDLLGMPAGYDRPKPVRTGSDAGVGYGIGARDYFNIIMRADRPLGHGARRRRIVLVPAIKTMSRCVCRKLRFEHIGDVSRRPWHATRCVRSAEPGARQAHPCPMNGAFARCCNSSRKILGLGANAVRPMR